MAGDWIKVQTNLPDKPEVHYVAKLLNIDPDAVVGKLIRVWSWFDQNTENGDAVGVTIALLDRITFQTGFGEALLQVGWMREDGVILRMPKFDRHTSKSAKNRALTSERMASKRGKDRDANVTLEASPEKRREDIKKSSGSLQVHKAGPQVIHKASQPAAEDQVLVNKLTVEEQRAETQERIRSVVSVADVVKGLVD